jgi:formylglycine-generating enzyme required for sulfatase activity
LGWNNFYIMKYEISQDSYSGFLNCLTYTQQFHRTSTPPQNAPGTLVCAQGSPSRNGIRIRTSGVPDIMPAVYGCDLNANGTFDESDDGGNIACNWLSWADLMAYLDWAALRPMSEFEFEKACRGTVPGANPAEYAWSNTLLLQAVSSSLVDPGTGSEQSTSAGDGLCAFGANSAALGPLRCGFAASSGTTRFSSGGSYYGVMELSGNVAEQCVGGYNFNYSAFTTANGNGGLTANGQADTPGWPPLGGGQNGGVSRGGDWFNASSSLRVSDRGWMINNTNQGRLRTHGGRGVRSF